MLMKKHLGEVRGVSPVGVVRAEDGGDLVGAGGGGGERGKVSWVSVTRVVVDLKGDIASVRSGSGPDLVTGRADDVAEVRVLEADTGVLGPWATKVDGTGADGRARSSGDVGVVDDIELLTGGGRTSSGDGTTTSRDGNVTVVDPDVAVLAKDEVDGSLDVGLGVELVTGLSEKSVLVSVETDAVVTLLGTVGAQGQSLGAFAVGVLDVDVVEGRVVSIVADSASVIIITGTAEQAGAVGNGDLVSTVGGSVRGLSVDSESSLTGWNVDLLRVGTSLDVDALGSGRGGAQRVNGILNLYIEFVRGL
jgi:hypothetical protein